MFNLQDMAASSSSSSSTAKKYDVFLSFRGVDTRHTFASHLHSALSRFSIKPYIDNRIERGDEISTSLIKAIQDSHGSLVVLSQNYASSKWCLEELTKILDCRKNGHFIIPVFYNIDPTHVRNQTGSYGEAFAKHEQIYTNNREVLQKWKAALAEVANIAGWDSQSRVNRHESELIQNIVEDVLQKLDHIYQPSEQGLVGVEEYCEHIESLLQRFPAIGIWGMGGIGKTTIAKTTFNKLYSQYDSCCFFENVREETKRSGLNHLRDKLLSELLKDENFQSSTPKALRFKYATRALSNKKVLMVLDDLDSFKQIEHLRQEINCLRPDSKIIITTRDKHLLTSLRVDYEIYEVKGLNFEESLHLFKLNAFSDSYPEKGYEKLSEKMVRYTKGVPIALKVLGSFLLSKSKKEWKSVLEKLKKIPHEDIQEVLRLSYDGLNHEEQQIFLDIACFLKGESITHVTELSEGYGFFPDIGMRTLQDRALIVILKGNVWMHDLIQEMGWEIVREESIRESGQRTRLWDFEEVHDVLKNSKGMDVTEGIIVDMSEIKDDLYLRVDTFEKMINLRFLKFYSSQCGVKSVYPTSIDSFSDKLRYFHWYRYPLQFLPSTFYAEKLVELHMPNSNIKKLWEGIQDLKNLIEIDLSGCTQLIELPNFSKASKLKRVCLSYCENLCQVHPSLLLHTLVSLDLLQCVKLKSLKSDIHLRSLQHLHVEGCHSLEEFSLSSEKIEELDLGSTAIKILPSSIGRCSNIRSLILRDDSSLSKSHKLRLDGSNVTTLPRSIKHISCLIRFDMWNFTRLQSLPKLSPFIARKNANRHTFPEAASNSQWKEIKPWGVSALEYQNFTHKMVSELELGLDNKTKEYRHEKQQISQIKTLELGLDMKSNTCQDIDEIGDSTIGVGGYEFDHKNQDELESLNQTSWMNSFCNPFQLILLCIIKGRT